MWGGGGGGGLGGEARLGGGGLYMVRLADSWFIIMSDMYKQLNGITLAKYMT